MWNIGWKWVKFKSEFYDNNFDHLKAKQILGLSYFTVYLNIEDNDLFLCKTIYLICTFKENMIRNILGAQITENTEAHRSWIGRPPSQSAPVPT